MPDPAWLGSEFFFFHLHMNVSCDLTLTTAYTVLYRTREIYLSPKVVPRKHPTTLSPSQGPYTSGRRRDTLGLVSHFRPLPYPPNPYDRINIRQFNGSAPCSLRLSHQGDGAVA